MLNAVDSVELALLLVKRRCNVVVRASKASKAALRNWGAVMPGLAERITSSQIP